MGAYNQSVGSFDQRLAPQGRRFADLVVGTSAELPALDTLDASPRVSANVGADESDAGINSVAADN